MTELEERLRASRPEPPVREALSESMRAMTRAILAVRSGASRRTFGRRLALAMAAVLVFASAAAAGVFSLSTDVLSRTPGEGSTSGTLAATGEIAAWVERDGGASSRVMTARRQPDGSWAAPQTLAENGTDVRVASTEDRGALAIWTTNDGVYSARLGQDGRWMAADLIRGSEEPAIKLEISYSNGGEVLAAWETAGAPKRALVAVFEDGEWEAAHQLPTPPDADAFAPTVAIGTDGTLAAGWQVLDRGGAEVRAALRPADGAWRDPVTLGRARSAGDAHVAMSDDGRALAAWTGRATDHAGGQVMYSSATLETGWQQSVRLSAGGSASAPRVAALPEGAVVVWTQRDRAEPAAAQLVATNVSSSNDVGPVTHISDEDGTAITPALATDAQGRIAVAWSERLSDDRAVLNVAKGLPSGHWSPAAQISDGQGYAFRPSIASTSGGVLALWTEVRRNETSLRTAVLD